MLYHSTVVSLPLQDQTDTAGNTVYAYNKTTFSSHQEAPIQRSGKNLSPTCRDSPRKPARAAATDYIDKTSDPMSSSRAREQGDDTADGTKVSTCVLLHIPGTRAAHIRHMPGPHPIHVRHTLGTRLAKVARHDVLLAVSCTPLHSTSPSPREQPLHTRPPPPANPCPLL